ncbi:50S ribosomal protein L25 [Candidatus Saccharibacteria bacterium]|nr:50S ribosomal protein L25 [Candidatus Saccharibacteria bacterium]
MGDKITLKLGLRDQRGKKVARLRAQGIVPGVVYGQGFDPMTVQAEYNVMEKAVREAGKHAPVHLSIDGKSKIALIKDIERDPVKARIKHVSFHAVKANEVVHAEVPIRLVGEGESAAEKAGLVVLQAIENIEIKAKPAELPDALEVSIAGLASTEDKITLNDLTLPAGVEFADAEIDFGLVVANVYEPAALEAANEAAAGDATEDTEVESENGEEAEAAEGSEEPKES